MNFTRNEFFGCSPRPASGISLQLNIQDFESLSETSQCSSGCEDASFWYPVSAGMKYKTKLDEDDGFGEIIPLCREHTLYRVNPQSRAYEAILEGPVLEVHIVKILDNFGIEVAIPSPNDAKRTFYVLKSRGKSRFVDELHFQKCRT